MKNKQLSKLFLLILTIFLLVPIGHVFAEDEDDDGDLLLAAPTYPVALNRGAIDLNAALQSGYVRKINFNLDTTPLVEKFNQSTGEYVDVTAQATGEPGIQLETGDRYRVTYEDAFVEGGNLITIVLDFSNVRIKDSSDSENSTNRIIVEDNADLGKNITTMRTRYTGYSGNSWPETWGDYTTDYDFIESYYYRPVDTTDSLQPYNFTGLVGIYDIDNADYLFNTRNKILYYTESLGTDWGWYPITDRKAGDHMFIYADGIKRDRNDYNATWGYSGYQLAGLYIPVTNEQSFSMSVKGNGDYVHCPLLYKYNTANYKVEYYYQDINPDTGEPYYDDQGKAIYPETYYKQVEREGIIGTTVSVTDEDKEPEKEKYEIDENREEGYTGVVLDPDTGELILKVYFKRNFTVIYNDGVKDENIFDDQTTTEIPYNTNTPEFVRYNPENPDDDLLKRREGYDFVKWNPVVEEKVVKDGYYEAQWDPWDYTIKYSPGCSEGEYSGIMPDHIYEYPHPTMDSDPLGYRRDGYDFIGFAYTDPEGITGVYQPGTPFKTELLKPENNREILLTALWKKTEHKEVKIPVTGIE